MSCTGCSWDGGSKRRRTDNKIAPSLSESAEVHDCPTLKEAAASLMRPDCAAAHVQRPLDSDVAKAVAVYVTSAPRWPGAEEYHPLEATWDLACVIDFTNVPLDHLDPLGAGIAYGRWLPPRSSPQPASSRAGIATVLSVLPEELKTSLAADAAELLLALRSQTSRRQYKLSLELILGDTCQKWHCDRNICRSLVTYRGPGTILAHERNVTRGPGNSVEAVCEEACVQAAAGDFVLMKGGVWNGAEGRGVAHRAPPIGAVPECHSSRHRLVLKIDILEDF